jgi:alpha-amylase
LPLRFVFAAHNHQPVGNFGAVFEAAYRDAYKPFLDVLEQFPEITFVLHTSGPLMEWLAEHRPEYVERLRRLVGRGQVEVLGGPFYEPVLTMIPPRDRVGQMSGYKSYLEKLLSTRVRGLWVPERVWEPCLVGDVAAAGLEFTVLDDHHFRQAGADDGRLFGHHLTEDNGSLLRVFPISERIRYLVPFHDPQEALDYLGHVHRQHPGGVVVFGDDGEKFGSWPGTHGHVYTNGWLRRFCELLRNNRHWLETCTFSQALDETRSAGKIYLPDCSYREMTEWALPPHRHAEHKRLAQEMQHDHRWGVVHRSLRGGSWRNFKVRYPETQEMYARMLQVSRRLQRAEDEGSSAAAIEAARRDLYKAQCNCPWWHGTFGGLYLPHLRDAVYRHLIAADNALIAAERRAPGWVEAVVADHDLDGGNEVCLSNHRLAAFFHPARGGTLYELDLRVIEHNLLATLSRRPEAYHDAVRHHAQGVAWKQGDLDQHLRYDWYLRKALVDHFYDPALTLHQIQTGQEHDLGDFAIEPFEFRIHKSSQLAQLVMARAGQVAGHPLRLTKTITLTGDGDALAVQYRLENCPRHKKLHFAVECNFAGLAAGADDRYFYHAGKPKAGQLQTPQDLHDAEQIGLVDEWRGLDASLRLSRRGGVWAFPVQTVSLSEGGYELVHQSTAVVPHWHVEADAGGRWEVTLTMRLDASRAEGRLRQAA